MYVEIIIRMLSKHYGFWGESWGKSSFAHKGQAELFDEHFGKFSQKSLIWFVKKIEEEVHPL